MSARNFTLVFLALTLAGCANFTVMNDASKWTTELASSESPPSGPCCIYDDLHRLMLEGALVSGKMDGTWTSWASSGGRLVVWSYHQGVRSGPVEMWYGPLAYPEARGRLKLEGRFVDGEYDGPVTRYYPSGERQSVRVYEHGVLKSCQYWSPSGREQSVAAAKADASEELQADLTYLAALEDMVRRSLAQGHRDIETNMVLPNTALEPTPTAP